MNQRATHHRILKPWQRYVSLFLTVVWLSVLVQPCVMAGSCDTVGTVIPGMGQMASTGHEHSDCTHCSSPSADCGDCSPALSHACSKADSTVGFDTTAAFEQKTKVKKFELFTFDLAQLAKSHLHLKILLSATPPESFPPGPSIMDLFQTYLN